MFQAATVNSRNNPTPVPMLGSQVTGYRLQERLQELLYQLQEWLQEIYMEALKVLYNKGCGGLIY